MAEKQYALTPAAPVRRFPLIAALDLVGFALFVLGLGLGHPVMIIIGAVVIIIGAVLIILGLAMFARVTTRVVVGDSDVRITSGGRTASATWVEISDVSSSGQTIYLNRYGDQLPLKIDSPRGAADPRMAELSAELVARLDLSRGYRDL